MARANRNAIPRPAAPDRPFRIGGRRPVRFLERCRARWPDTRPARPTPTKESASWNAPAAPGRDLFTSYAALRLDGGLRRGGGLTIGCVVAACRMRYPLSEELRSEERRVGKEGRSRWS